MSIPDNFGPGFEETERGQFIIKAHCYISAAGVLRNSETWEKRAALLQIPTLHLLAHGVELLLKFPFLWAGETPDCVRRNYGHDLRKLWASPQVSNLRKHIELSAEEAWEAAQESGRWPADNFLHGPKDSLERGVELLAHLHGGESGFALRYLTEPAVQAPHVLFLIEAFGDTAERIAMAPSLINDPPV